MTRDRVTRYLEPAIPLTEREREREREKRNESLPGIDRHDGFETTLVAKRNTIGILVPAFEPK